MKTRIPKDLVMAWCDGCEDDTIQRRQRVRNHWARPRRKQPRTSVLVYWCATCGECARVQVMQRADP